MADSSNPAFRGAFRKGIEAARCGAPRRAPYRDHKAGRYGHIPTFSRGFIRAWLEGYDSHVAPRIRGEE